MRRRILITGGMGCIGGRMAQMLAVQGELDIMLGSRQAQSVPVWLPDSHVISMDWRSPESLLTACDGVDTVLHLAAMNDAECMQDPPAALEVNGVYSARLVEAAKTRGVTRFVYLSTAHVYGSPLRGVITEETCPISLNPYATSHRAGEDVVRAAHQRGEIEGIVIRLSNSYGAPAHKDANCWMLLMNDLCRQAVTTQRMVLRSSGLQRRDFITLTDACRAIRHLLELPADKLGDGLFNVGGAWSPTIFEITQRVADRVTVIMNQRPEIVRKIDQSIKNPELLDYGIKKLIDTGFVSGGTGNVDQEIDSLIQACINYFCSS